MSNDTLTQKAYQHIHDKLSGGLLQPGSRLSNRGVAKEVGISFTPVREALSRLVSEGLLEYRQGLGVFVPMSNIQEIRESYELREILESEAASMACRNLSPGMLAEMNDSYERMLKIFSEISDPETETTLADRSQAWQIADSDFHMSLLRATGNRRLLDTVEGLQTSLKVMMGGLQESTGIVGHRFAGESLDHIKRTLDEHHRILEALKQSDADAAKALMIEHIRTGMELALTSHNHNHMSNATSFLRGPHRR